ncbi:hypothetical protein ACGF0J_08435 [Nonomuraea sp. NPDC047897]|uniref:hypothetical protein n=1 Tax=Nonomuraea sp. NPDC047897 TaxID=3364346 RepID=UPI00371B537F
MRVLCTVRTVTITDRPTTIHFVGSYPANSAREALRDMLTDETKSNLYALTDGETDRKDWVVDQIESYRRNPAFVLVEDGDWSDYTRCPAFAVAPGRELLPEDIGLRYHEWADASWETFDAARRAAGRPDLRYQVGIPTGFDMALFTLGPERGMREDAIEAFVRATVEQIEAIHGAPYGGDVVYQLETPAGLSLALAVDDPAYRRGLAMRLVDLVARAPEGSRFGIHLCVGDLGNEARTQPATRRASVEFANAVAENWPAGRHLDFVHEPIAAGRSVPRRDEAMYADLGDLRLPSGTRYIAGMVHEAQRMEDQQAVLALVRRHLPEGQSLGVAAACGLGRRSREAARDVVRRMTRLTR